MGKMARVTEIDKNTVYLECPKCRGSGTRLVRSGGFTTHKLCQTCGGSGGMNVPKKVLQMFLRHGRS